MGLLLSESFTLEEPTIFYLMLLKVISSLCLQQPLASSVALLMSDADSGVLMVSNFNSFFSINELIY